jgi:hypothetical protein
MNSSLPHQKQSGRAFTTASHSRANRVRRSYLGRHMLGNGPACRGRVAGDRAEVARGWRPNGRLQAGE